MSDVSSLEFILSLRDEASAVFQQYIQRVQDGSMQAKDAA